MESSVQAEPVTAVRPTPIRWGRVLAWVGAMGAALACVGCAALAMLLDGTALAANLYLGAVSSNNRDLALLMADHYSQRGEANRALYGLDLSRDIAWLGGATISDVQATRDTTLSGQTVTLLTFKWRPAGSSGPLQNGALRVKTERWFALTYIKTVEIAGPYP
jgi:hypothetical protein